MFVMSVWLMLVFRTSSVMIMPIIVQHLSSTYSLPLSFPLPRSTSQWEGQSWEATRRAAAGGGLPACWAGGTSGNVTGAPETAGLPEAAEGGSGDAANTPAHRGPERVQPEHGGMTVTQPHIPSPVIVFKLRLFRVQISNTCHYPDDIWRKM